MIQLVLVGTGNVATHLFKAFQQSPVVQVVQVVGRNEASLSPFATHSAVTTDSTHILPADVYVLAISDNAIATVAETLPMSNAVVVHTSGSVPMEALQRHRRHGVFYPLQTFSKTKAVDFSDIPLCLEASDEDTMNTLEQLAQSISQQHYRLNSTQRGALHTAAVFVCNFVNHLYQIGYEITAENQLPFDILLPLIKETATKVESMTPYEAQTGPAKRNDTQTMATHLRRLHSQHHKEIYNLLTAAIHRLHQEKTPPQKG